MASEPAASTPFFAKRTERSNAVRIEDIMTRDVRACSPGDTMGVAAQIMWENDCGVVPVVDDEQRVVGIITDRDLAMAAHLQGVALRDSRVASAMARDIKSCSPRDTPAMVQAMMQQYRIRRVLVVDEQKRLLGIVSLGDLAYAMSSQQTLGGDGMTWTAIAHTLAAVSEPRVPRYAPRFPGSVTPSAPRSAPPPISGPSSSSSRTG
jgi:CBS domain-containing protein